MKHVFLTLLLSVSSALVFADEKGEIIFEDDFERTESQEEKDEPGNGWTTNSKTRAKGNKQVDLKEGAMYIYIHEEADHGVSVKQEVSFTDGSVKMRFMLEDKKDTLGLNFADSKYKAVHAGHLFVVKISPKQVQLQDLKTGNMDLKVREAKLAGTTTEGQKEMLKTKVKKFPADLEVGSWHDLLVQVEGDKLIVEINGEKAGEFASEGIAHPTKRALRLAVNRNAVVDDIQIRRMK